MTITKSNSHLRNLTKFNIRYPTSYLVMPYREQIFASQKSINESGFPGTYFPDDG